MPPANEARPSSLADNDEIDLRELLGTLLDHKWLIILVTGLFFVLAVAYVELAAPVYEADALVQVEQKVPTLPGLSDLSELAGDTAPQAVTEIALMTSRNVVGKAVDALHLTINVQPDRFPLIGGFIARHYTPDTPGAVAAPWLWMSRYDWGGSELQIAQMKVPAALAGLPLTVEALGQGRFELSNDGTTLFKGRVGKAVSGGGVTMRVQALHANPGMHFTVIVKPRLQAIADVQKLLGAIEQTKDSGIIAASYQDEDPAKAAAVLNAVIGFYVQQNVDRASADAAQSLSFVKSQLPGIRKKLNAAESKLANYQTKAKTADMSMQTKSLLDQIVDVESQLSQLKLQQAELARKFTPQHPAYQALMQQIGDLEAKRGGLEKQVTGLPDTQKSLLKLTRDVKVGTETYTNMLGQEQQLSIAKADTVGNARIVDNAAVNTAQPVSPRKALIVIALTLVGGMLAVGWVFVRQMLNRGVEDPALIEQLGLPVYASVPMSGRQRELEGGSDAHSRLLALDEPSDLAIEAIRSLRTSLHFAMMEAKNNVLMISGASPDAGKTFVSTNLAAVVGQSGQRVLLLDADMRKGTLHRVMGHASQPGLSELLSGQAGVDEAVRPTDVDGLSFVGRGSVPPNPSELLMHPNFARLVEELGARCDLLIIDTPPILAVTDAAIIGAHAGTSLMVARFGMNQSREIALAMRRFEQNRVRLKGAIFNAVQKRAAGYYSYGYYEYKPEGA